MRGFVTGASLGAVVAGIGVVAGSYLIGTPVGMPEDPGNTGGGVPVMGADVPAMVPEDAPGPDPTPEEPAVPDQAPAEPAPAAADPDPMPETQPDETLSMPEPEVSSTGTGSPPRDRLEGGSAPQPEPDTRPEDPPPAPAAEVPAVADAPAEIPPAAADAPAEIPPAAETVAPPEPSAPDGAEEDTALTDPPRPADPTIETPAVSAPDAPAAADARPEGDTAPDPAPGVTAPDVAGRDAEDLPAEPDVLIDRLPRIGGTDIVTDTAEVPEADPEPASEGPAITAFGTPFDLPQGVPAMSIVLFDPGISRPDPADLRNFPVPLTIVIDPATLDAGAAMAAYRAAGHEVAVLAPVAAAASPDEAARALADYLDAVPEAAVVFDVPAAQFQESRTRATRIAEVLVETGAGLITYERGLNSGLQAVVNAGVPAAAVFRDFDDGVRGVPDMKRLLDVGAFRAAQEGGVILTGELRRESIAALTEWVLSSRAATVTLAPVSALLLSR